MADNATERDSYLPRRMVEDMLQQQKALLSIQRALLGVVTPALRAVAVEVKEGTLLVVIYHDGEVPPEYRDDLTAVLAEVAADLPPEIRLVDRIARLDSPTPIPVEGTLAYQRRE